MFKPLYDVYICYGHEEFFECKGADENEQKQEELNFQSMMESKWRMLNRLTQLKDKLRETQDKLKSSNDAD